MNPNDSVFAIAGISVSSKTDGVLVLHMPVEDKSDKVIRNCQCFCIHAFSM